ncbi:gamma-glutamyl-gamma-aminobutyrate hydrolase family protein [Endozoicomonas elysicola]|uniref:gamma-glutamyl-gamma-aminobutyrate hydrolase n=1 Tax=Endozoicomonas elysicola TaxID=305900 RepID=A0A081K9Y9_9GAMM|nr:gamma-glutamyl-gamma-aminobutyrate hydrolase family protein [Endozoicomonas elysicola]KEI70965.1 peptidase C26 [Endozoicomonas elysicola]
MGTHFRPLIGVTADTTIDGLHRVHQAGEKYLSSVVHGANAIPVIIPSLPAPLDSQHILSQLDGLLVTGGYSNIEPWRYSGAPAGPGAHEDPQRDNTTLQLIPDAIELGIPLLGICRGFQEMNVAFGGTLHQKLHDVGQYIEHREDKTAPLDTQYGPAHSITIEAGGLLSSITSSSTQMVNSVHMQGINRLGDGLNIEARAPDGLIEAISVQDSKSFALAVQWHPEYKVAENDFSMTIYQAFAEACRSRHYARKS